MKHILLLVGSAACIPNLDVSGNAAISCRSTADCPDRLVCMLANQRCRPAACGDGYLRAGEACDDGNTQGGDGCSAACGTEAGWACARPGSPCAPICDGNGIADPTEACDDGGDSPICNADCRLAACGDLYVNRAAAEQCEVDGPGLACLRCRAWCDPGTGDCDRNPLTGCECSTGSDWRQLIGTTGDADTGLAVATVGDGASYGVAALTQAGSAYGQFVCADNATVGCARDLDCPGSRCLRGAAATAADVLLVARINTAGEVTAVRTVSGSSTSADRASIAADLTGAVVLGRVRAGGAVLQGSCTSGASVGNGCTSPADCGGGACSARSLASRGGDDLFLARYDTALGLVWVVQMGGAGDESAGGLALSAAGDVYVTGAFGRSAAVGPSTADLGSGITLTNAPEPPGGAPRERLFVARYALNNGVLRWAATATGGNSGSRGLAVAALANGGVVVTGGGHDALLSFGNGVETDLAGVHGMLTFAYDRGGVAQWASFRAGLAQFDGLGATELADGSIVVVASFTPPIQGFDSTCVVGGAACGPFNACAAGACDTSQPAKLLVAWLGNAGVFQSQQVVTANGGDAGALAVAARPDDAVVVAGYITGSASLTSSCYLGSENGNSCGTGCPSGQCGHTVNPGGNRNAVVLIYAPDTPKTLLYGGAFGDAVGNAEAAAVGMLADGSAFVAGSFCRGNSGACEITFDSGVPLASGGGSEAFVWRRPAP